MRAFDRPIIGRRAAALALIAATLAACGGDGGSGPSTINGTYALESVNGASLPTTAAATINGATYSARFTAGCCAVVLNADGTFQRSFNAQVTQSGIPFAVPVVADDQGTFSANGGAVHFFSILSRVTVAGQVYPSTQVDTSTATASGKRLTFGSDPALGIAATLVFAKP